MENFDGKDFPTMKYSDEDKDKLIKSTVTRIEERNSDKIINSIKNKMNKIGENKSDKDIAKKWLKKYSSSKPSFIIFNINQDFINMYKTNYLEKIFSVINYMYNTLKNYRHVAIVFKENIVVDNVDITWELLSKISIYMENFIEFKGKFQAFKRNKKIEELDNFLKTNQHINYNENCRKLVENFYNSISTGFSFCDLLLSDDEKVKILIMRKIELDNTPILCPSCFKETARGNSYPIMFLRSWECQNPNCPDRSKSGRGKRYDEYGTFRYFKLVENDKNNRIDKKMYNDWHRDIFNRNLDYYNMLLMYYAWNNENIILINDTYFDELKTRKIIEKDVKEIKIDSNIKKFDDLKIVKFLDEILKYYRNIDNQNIKKLNKKNIIHEDSTIGIQKIPKNKVSCAITSPPYYNAREYSTWPNFLAYLIDMMLNSKAIFDLSDSFTYLYNVGDIVDNDNIYVSSNMSKRRIMLGFYSVLIFRVVGFKLAGNIIWDKGEVESKRNSSVNLVSGYLKYVNCYEHVLIFMKNNNVKAEPKIYKIKPVYKINSKGENILGHTAPYPIELVELIRKYANKEKYILDPFLGSGTTGIWCRDNNFNFIGFELNNEYYKLCLKRI